MKIPFLPVRHRSLEEIEDIRASRMAGIRRMIVVAGIIVIAFVAFLVSMLVLPSMLELQSLRHEKRYQLAELELARQDEKKAHDSYIWLSDPEYYEQIARDNLNMAKEGDTVVRPPEPQPAGPSGAEPVNYERAPLCFAKEAGSGQAGDQIGQARNELEQARGEEKAHDANIRLSGPGYYEQTARDRLNAAKDGDTVLRTPEPQPAEPASSDR